MRQRLFILLLLCTFAQSAFAMLSLELTRGVAGAMPIAIVPFATQGGPTQDLAAIISNDLQNSGRFKVTTGSALSQQPFAVNDVHFDYFKGLHVDNVVIGQVQALGGNRYQVSFQLLDVYKGQSLPAPQQSIVLTQKFTASDRAMRAVAHRVSDAVYQQLTGVRGIFSTKLAYIVVQRNPGAKMRYILEVSDQDGYNPQPLLNSPDPIMSPAWSPDGRSIAYVSFENHHAAIYLEDVATGSRQVLSNYRGINGAPAFAPNGHTLALALSKSGALNIYQLDLGSRQLSQVTNNFYINTEPAWSPDGKKLLYTSNQSGNPQVYELNLATGTSTRLTYEGKYNARASYTPDGTHIVVLNQTSGLFNIGILDLDSGVFRVLTQSGTDNESPSVAPNGSMVLFGTLYNGRSVLGMAATDGSVQIRLPAREGEVQDPAWSPFLV